MGHPASVVWLPSGDDPALAAAVARVTAAHGGSPAELAALLRTAPGPRTSQLAALAWVLDPRRRHVLLVDHPVLGWSCPGGHVESGERPVATAARELREETGLSLDPESSDPVTVSRDEMPADDRGPAHVHWNVGYLFTGDPAAPVTGEPGRPVAWFPVAALPRPAVPDLAPLLAALTRPDRHGARRATRRSASSRMPRPSRPAGGGRPPSP